MVWSYIFVWVIRLKYETWGKGLVAWWKMVTGIYNKLEQVKEKKQGNKSNTNHSVVYLTILSKV